MLSIMGLLWSWSISQWTGSFNRRFPLIWLFSNLLRSYWPSNSRALTWWLFKSWYYSLFLGSLIISHLTFSVEFIFYSLCLLRYFKQLFFLESNLFSQFFLSSPIISFFVIDLLNCCLFAGKWSSWLGFAP